MGRFILFNDCFLLARFLRIICIVLLSKILEIGAYISRNSYENCDNNILNNN